MNAIMNETNNGVKILAAILAMTMIFVGAAVVLSDSEVNAALDDATEWDGTGFDSDTGKYTLTADVKLSKDIVLTEGQTIDLATFTLYTNGYYLGVNGGSVMASIENDVQGTLDQTAGTGPWGANNFYVVDGTVNLVKFTNFNTAISNNNNSGAGNEVIINNCTFVPTASSSYSGIYIDMHGQEVSIMNTEFGNLTSYTGKALNLALYNEADKTKVKVSNCDGISLKVFGPQDGSSADNALSFGNANTTNDKNVLDVDDDTPIESMDMAPVTEDDPVPTVSIDKPTQIGETTGQGNLLANDDFVSDVKSDEIVYSMPGQLAIGDTINADLTVEDQAYLTDDLVIPEGRTLTIAGTGSLNMSQYDITINGTLVIERNGVITSTQASEGNGIVLTRTGIIQNSGIIGDVNMVTITGQGIADQSISMKGVSGVSMSLARSGNVYNLVVSGDIAKISSVDDAQLKIKGVTVNDDLTIGRNVTFTAENVTVAKNVVFTVNNNAIATLTGTFELLDGASAVINGSTAGTISVKTGYVGNEDVIYQTPYTKDSTDVQSTYSTVVLTKNVKGITVIADRVTLPNADGTGSDVVQRLFVNGTLGQVDSKNETETDNKVTFTGSTLGAADATYEMPTYVSELLYIPEEIAVEGTFDVSVSGAVQDEEDQNVNSIDYIGAYYTVESTVENVTSVMAYYTSFDAAMNAISTAVDQEITIAGEFTIDQSYEVAAEQSIAGDSEVTVGENATITVLADGSVSNTAFQAIEGRVVVNEGGYKPAADTQYAVMTSNKETGVTVYSGFKIALDNAAAGDVIDIVGNATYKGNMTIISGVTVNVGDDLYLKVTGNVTVQTDGELNLGNSSDLIVGTPDRDATITVAGTIDASESGAISAAVSDDNTKHANVNLYSTGSVITVGTGIADTNVKANSAYYTDGDCVYTSVSNAAAYIAKNGLTTPVNATGTFSETGDIALEGVDLVIVGNDSAVTLGNVALSDGASIAVDSGATGAVYTATVTGPAGVGEAAVDSTVSVSKSTVGVSSGSVLNSSGAYEYSLSIDGIDGTVTVSAGTVTLDTADSIVIDRSNALTVANGATLVIAGDAIDFSINMTGDLDNNNYLVNEGTIEVQTQVTIKSDMILSGDVVIDNGGQITVGTWTDSSITPNVTGPYVLTITGTLTVSAEENNEGAMTLNGGALFVGAAPELLGATGTGAVVGQVDMSNGAYVAVFNGASVADADLMDGTVVAEATSYVINDIEYATVYATDGVAYNVLDKTIMTMENLEFTQTKEGKEVEVAPVWYYGEQEIKSGAVGDYDVLTAEVEYAGVDIRISEGPGLSIYIDDINVGNLGSVNLTIGEHTITVYVDAGYEGTPVVTLNGTTISGTFTVTSDMLGGDNIIYATGASPSQGGQVVIPGDDDSGMGLTDYLLIILVILIVIMAIMVAMRLMRS